MDKTVCLGFAVLKLIKLILYEAYYDKLQLYFGGKKHSNTLYRQGLICT